jgi:hypothetical protein
LLRDNVPSSPSLASRTHTYAVGKVKQYAPERGGAEWARFLDVYHNVFPNPLPRDVRRIEYVAFNDEWRPRGVPNPRCSVSNAEVLGLFELTAFLKIVDDLW